MLKPLISIICASAILSISTPVFAGKDCTCRGNGKQIPEGQTVCLKMPSGPVLATCSSVLNNTAWKIIQKGCPIGAANTDKKMSLKVTG